MLMKIPFIQADEALNTINYKGYSFVH